MTNRELIDGIYLVTESLYDKHEARSIAFLVAQKLYGLSPVIVITEPNNKIADFNSAEYKEICQKLSENCPIQYILGETEFYGLFFKVCEGVLIPRPETEELVKLVIEECQVSNPTILDIGTGSGAIAISLAKTISTARVEAIDISEKALSIATENAQRNNVKITFSKVDILADNLPADRFDIIVSNPPYIPKNEKVTMSRNVTDYEPQEALFVPNDEPLLFYQAIAQKGQKSLHKGGRLYFEVHENFADQTKQMLLDEGYSDVEIFKDINDKSRMIRCLKM